jgi:FK506-binding protein 1
MHVSIFPHCIADVVKKFTKLLTYYSHYIGYLEDGTCFDHSYQRGQPLYFILGAGQVIPALEMVFPTMSRGEKARIVIPAEYGYGDKGYPPIIPPKAILLYELELITFSSVGTAERELRERKEKDPYAL